MNEKILKIITKYKPILIGGKAMLVKNLQPSRGTRDVDWQFTERNDIRNLILDLKKEFKDNFKEKHLYNSKTLYLKTLYIKDGDQEFTIDLSWEKNSAIDFYIYSNDVINFKLISDIDQAVQKIISALKIEDRNDSTIDALKHDFDIYKLLNTGFKNNKFTLQDVLERFESRWINTYSHIEIYSSINPNKGFYKNIANKYKSLIANYPILEKKITMNDYYEILAIKQKCRHIIKKNS